VAWGLRKLMNLANVDNVLYNEQENILTVRYQGGSVVQYRPVNPENYTEIVMSNCLSQAVQKTIRQTHVVGIAQQRGH